jgi:hypothetical protein
MNVPVHAVVELDRDEGGRLDDAEEPEAGGQVRRTQRLDSVSMLSLPTSSRRLR